MKKTIIAFDLDGTLTASRSPITAKGAELLKTLLDYYDVCIITGGTFQQIQKQVVEQLKSDSKMERLHLLPASGTQYYHFKRNNWEQVYSEIIPVSERKRIIEKVAETAQRLDLWTTNPKGRIVEDRLSQITFSALGQRASVSQKTAWDPDDKKKQQLVQALQQKLPSYEIKAGGLTSVDITLPGTSKARSLAKLIKHNNWHKHDVLFIGDRIEKGGNDYSIKQMHFSYEKVNNWHETEKLNQKLISQGRDGEINL